MYVQDVCVYVTSVLIELTDHSFFKRTSLSKSGVFQKLWERICGSMRTEMHRGIMQKVRRLVLVSCLEMLVDHLHANRDIDIRTCSS